MNDAHVPNTAAKTAALTSSLTAALDVANDVHYTLKARPAQLALITNRSLARGVVVIDDTDSHANPLQLIVPNTHLVELDALNRQLGGDFRALNDTEKTHLLTNQNTTFVPSIPGWNNFECIVHESLLHQDTILLELEAEGELVELDQASFAALCDEQRIQSIAQPAPTLPDTHDGDERAIQNSLKHFTKRRIEQRLGETLELPPLPRTASQVIQMRGNPDASIDDLVEIVESDPMLAAQVVSWAASPYYGAPGTVKCVQEAIVRVLGFDMVLNLALGLSLANSLKLEQISVHEVNRFWRDSMLNAATCEALSMGMPAANRPNRGAVYLCGLLSNLGYLILAEVFPLYFQQIRRQKAVNPHISDACIEHYVLGIHNQQIAASLLHHWQLPELFCNAVRYTHHPHHGGEAAPYSQLILCARHLLSRHGLSSPVDSDLGDSLLDQLGIDHEYASNKLAFMCKSTEEFSSD